MSYPVKLSYAIIVSTTALWMQNADAISGKPRVIDGDSLKFGAVSVRLHGIDAPEADQICSRGGQEWRCGSRATAALAALVKNRWVDCNELDKDRYGRIISVCSIEGPHRFEINRELVARGWAIAYRRYSSDYIPEELTAQKAGLGLWSGSFAEPEQWRRDKRNRLPAETTQGRTEDQDCRDFRNWEDAQSFYESATPGDPHGLDSDADGIACESLKQ